MNLFSRNFGGALTAGALGLTLAFVGKSVGAQDIRDVRIDLHPVQTQVGIVTRVLGKTAWVLAPRPLPVGSKIAFSTFSDGGDTMATGTVRYVTPVAPYEIYVADIAAASVKHSLNDYDSYFSFEALLKLKQKVGPRPVNEGIGTDLCIGFFARAPFAPATVDAESLEPVRAHVAELRKLKNKMAQAIADAASRALVADPLRTDSAENDEYAVNFSLLSDNLRRFRHIPIADPLTERLLSRLNDLAVEGGVGGAVPTDFLRPASQLSQQNGVNGNTPRP